MNAACPACGFRTVPEPFYGTYHICHLCGWEDDAVQLANPACGGGANPESLIEAQRAALAEYPLSCREAHDHVRDLAWRPLDADEVLVAESERDELYWKNKADLDLSAAYWLRTGEPSDDADRQP